ncbi:MAG: protein O-mannosyl-transferase family [Bacteroidota bacterium]
MNYKRLNNLVGWLIFGIAAYTYISTIEPTGSFWDCGEFIATAHKLEVGHPPGAPTFLLLARVFILFAGDNVKMFPIMVNTLSALMSAFTILFLFWTITHLARKLVVGKGEETTDKIIAILGAGAVGALAYTFSDSFWFSAVEGEVYASSSFFTAIVFWLILKWESVADQRHNFRWLILIAYLMGLSIGVHLLNLLAVPALAFVYYFKRTSKVTASGVVTTFAIGAALLGLIQYGIIQGMITLAGSFDLFFVNTLGMSFGSGIIFYGLLIIGSIIFGLIWTHKKNKPVWNTAILCVSFILIGYSSFAQIVIRSNANTPLDENNPENVFNFISYLKREQYGDRPLFYGQNYNARVVDQKEGAETWAKIDGSDKYVKGPTRVEPIYDPSKSTLFPRMWSNQQNHISEYKKWADIKGDRTPTLGDNIKFFFVYQLGEMYWRYFMWNFAGRQNDAQGPGVITKGNWISGIDFIDSGRLGPQDKIPESMKNNKARNLLYFLPFLLGIIGLVYQFNKANHDAWVVFLLFFMTGIAIVIYLNGYPLQPRERDYAYAGSYYAYAVWIGFGVLALYDFMRKKVPANFSALGATALCTAAVPVLMARAEWNDHDRSNRYTSRDFAVDYLQSCAKNAILFTNGDNDTFPLWYVQEVEGVRTDVRVVNLSLLNTDWYVDQLRRKYYDSDPIPISWTPDKYVLGRRDYIAYYDRGIKDPVELSELIEFMGSDDPAVQARSQSGEMINYYPTRKVRMQVDAAAVLANKVVTPDLANKIVPYLEFELPESYIMKNDLTILNILANNNWKRPIYFATTVGTDAYVNLQSYFQLEGLTYRLVPIYTPVTNEVATGRVATGIMYENVMNKFVFGNMNDEKIYLDENNIRMTTNFRINLARLAEGLLSEGKKDSAVKVLDKCIEITPDKTIPYNYFMINIAALYYQASGDLDPTGQRTTTIKTDYKGNVISSEPDRKGIDSTKVDKALIAKGNAIVERLTEIYGEQLDYYISLKKTKFWSTVDTDKRQAIYILNSVNDLVRQTSQKELSAKVDKRFMDLFSQADLQ